MHPMELPHCKPPTNLRYSSPQRSSRVEIGRAVQADSPICSRYFGQSVHLDRARVGLALHAKGVDLYLHQQGIDTGTPAGKAMFQMMGVFAEFERAMIVERVKAGLSRARAQGKRLGRRPVSSDVVERIRTQIGDRRGHPENGQGTRRRDRNSSSGQTGNENCGGLTGYDTRRQSPKSI